MERIIAKRRDHAKPRNRYKSSGTAIRSAQSLAQSTNMGRGMMLTTMQRAVVLALLKRASHCRKYSAILGGRASLSIALFSVEM